MDASTHERFILRDQCNPTHSSITSKWIKRTDKMKVGVTPFLSLPFFLAMFSPKFTHGEVCFAVTSKRHGIYNRTAFAHSLYSCSWGYLSPLQPHCSSLTHWDLFSCWQMTVSVWCHIIHGRNTWIHSSLWPYSSVQWETNVFFPHCK